MTAEELKPVNEAIETATKGFDKKFQELNGALDERLKKAEEQIQSKGKNDEELKTELKNLADQHQEYVKAVDKKFAEIQRLSAEESEQKPQTLIKSIHTLFHAKEAGKQSIAEQIKNNTSKQPIEVSLKAVGDMATGTNLTGTYILGYDQRPGIVIQPLYDAHLRQLFPQTTTEKPLIRYARETGSEGGFDMVAEGATKPEIDWDFDIVDAAVRKIAGYFRLTEEMMDDIPYLMTYMTNRGVEELKNKEDQQILYGTGTGQELQGINTVASAFQAGGSQIAFANYYDVLIVAKKQLRMLQLVPNYILVSPSDYASMRLMKDTQGRYIFPVVPGTDVITADGTPIIQNTRVNDGNFFIMDTRWAEIADRKQAQVRFYDQDRDNAIKNMITCVIEERLAFPIYRPQAFVKGSFTDAMAAINL